MNLRSFYNYFRTPENRGVGTGAFAYQRSQTIPVNSIYDPSRNVRGTLTTTATPGYMKLGQRVVPVSILGGGSELTGQFALAQLIQMQAQGDGK
jgi:hypothetical protein